ncbi:MAG TPA: hypothetical protein VEI07_18830 [Planctomycetaceae bacterium]|nr:hypothetical protein [Planctomycetaceae bacterium]
MIEPVETNPLAIIEPYREVIARMEAATDELGRDEWRRVAMRLRARWKEWQGEDSLHEMAFGEVEV